MNYNYHLISWLVAIIICLPIIQALDYEEIRKWNASCSPKDTCSIPRDLDDSDTHNCDCSSLCVLYDTCCIDSPFLNVTVHHQQVRTASCRSAGPTGEFVFMIDTCSANYRGSLAIRRRCEHNSKNWSDPFNNIPVTNPWSQKTYKSLFCAICNDEKPKELTMWQIAIDCSSLSEFMEVCTENREFVLSNMLYIREKGVWGLWSWDSKTDWKFRHLPVHFKIPPSLKTSVKDCRPNLISDCLPVWQDSRTRRLCNSYMGAIYFQETSFRNVHCALCNNVTDFSDMSCHEITKSPFKSPTPISFGMLLDVDLRDGDKVGTVEVQCGKDEVYDPFAKKCRSIECPLPGFTLKEGNCVQEK